MLDNIALVGTGILIPLIMILFGALLRNNPPKEINNYYGFRTKRSMRNIQTWEFANRYFGSLWLREGIFTLAMALVTMIWSLNQNDRIQGILIFVNMAFQVVLIFLDIYFTTRALKERFPEN